MNPQQLDSGEASEIASPELLKELFRLGLQKTEQANGAIEVNGIPGMERGYVWKWDVHNDLRITFTESGREVHIWIKANGEQCQLGTGLNLPQDREPARLLSAFEVESIMASLQGIH